MFDDVEGLFHENVLTAYVEFRDSLRSDTAGMNTDLRLAINAAGALYHFREHIPAGQRPTRSALVAVCPDYALAGDIINAAKHDKLTKGTPQVVSAADLHEAIVLTEYEDEQGPYQHAEKVVEVRLKDGTNRFVLEILTNVLNMWVGQLHKVELLHSVSPFTPSPHRVPSRASAGGAAQMSLQMTKGVRAVYSYIIQKYDDAIGKAVPRDISNDKYEWGMYAPIEIDIVFTHAESGRHLKGTMELTPREHAQFTGLATDRDREQFLAVLSQARPLTVAEDHTGTAVSTSKPGEGDGTAD